MVKIKRDRRLSCFFDSGIGGLPLFAECCIRRKDCDFAYFADNYNMPYGNLPHEEILRRADGIFERIACLDPDVAVVACNTVTAECIGFLREKYKFPIIGVQPAVKPAAEKCSNFIVLATPATAASNSLAKLVEEYALPGAKIIPCDGLAAYIENNVSELKREEIFKLLPEADCDGVVLGCTHYSYISGYVKEFYSAPVFDGLDGTAARFGKILGISDHFSVSPQNITFYGGNYLKNAAVFNLIMNRK